MPQLKQYSLFAFIGLALIQIFVPAKMALERELAIKTGTTFKFRIAPIDPNDPFRGKYVILNFSDNTVPIPRSEINALMTGRKLGVASRKFYLSIENDENGFAKIASYSEEIPTDTPNWFEVSLVSLNDANLDDDVQELAFEFPFNRFYMEESKAEKAEYQFNDRSFLEDKEVYALVTIKNGEYVLKDVELDGVSIRNLVGNKN